MNIPLQVSFEGCEPVEAVRTQIEQEAERLEAHYRRIVGCHVAVVAPSEKHHHGTGFEVRIRITAPPHETVIINHASSEDARHEHIAVAVKRAFSAARRQFDDLAKQI